MWAKSAKVALEKLDGDNTGFYKTKLATARYFMQRLLPQTGALVESLTAGGAALMSIDAESF
jgi:hypothetical protein